MRFKWYYNLSMVWESVLIVSALLLLCYSANASTNYSFRTSLQRSIAESCLTAISFSLLSSFRLCCVDVSSVVWFWPERSSFLKPKNQADECFLCDQKISSRQNLRALITIFPSVSGDNAFCVHQKRRRSVDGSQEKHAKDSAKVEDKGKTVQCFGLMIDISQAMQMDIMLYDVTLFHLYCHRMASMSLQQSQLYHWSCIS